MPDSVSQKKCKGCSSVLTLSMFYRHKGMSDGHLNFCKSCVKLRVRKKYKENMKDPSYVLRERGRNRRRASVQTKPYDYKRKARSLVSNAIRDGRLVPASLCEECGHDFSFYRREAHHKDYSRPLDVVWLCSRCHGIEDSPF